ncbi:type VI secretion system tip protein VgrG [Steroidobacter sp. S1-65]|uniref:Type VI secretion system tip protein VgrG n=1 Tax=Steroidobacter gossypii TaxID=2805490 RepID=A0ABS1X0I8_9GAMM|nr:type VI secretion system tip protein TssI/VgrG [Steroidobacter gossypii]MBM0106723.1 type VI secretion system tip protein VgrG [Steroidobacter gossypii]
MADYQQNRSVSIAGPGDMQGLMLTRLVATEQISRPFQFDLELCSMEGAASRGEADPDGILGKPVCVTLKTGPAHERYFHGVVTEFAYTGYNERRHEYRAIVRPAFWLLTRRADCRVLQNKSTPDIFAEVCRQAGFNDHRLELSARYEPWEYRVQYRESDFDFLSRLLEHEGIYYYFVHLSDKHVMVLTDDVGKLGTTSGYEEVPYYPPGGPGVHRERDHLSSWLTAKSFQPAAFAAREYNFETPASLAGGVSPVARRTEDASRFEIFDYPAGANQLTAAGVERVAKLRAEQMQASQSVVRSGGDAAGLAAGHLFKLKGHPRADMNKQYLITATSCELVSDGARTGASAGGEPPQFSISLEAIDSREPFRPARITSKPLIQGTQTAKVVGVSGEEITTDKYGRVKVQFHWDRGGTSNQDSSCWVRVAQSWAGKNWGMQFVPRIGQEVVVSFLEGDPDHPLIIGSVYNADQMPPYELPANQTQSGVKTRSSKQGTTEKFNEIRFDDKKDAEEIYIHAEKNMKVVVENDQTITVGLQKGDKGDRTTTIQNDDKLTVNGNVETTIKGTQTHKVTKDRVTTLEANDQADVKNKYTLKAGDQITLEVGMAKIVMKSDGTIEMSGAQIKIKGNTKVEIDGTQTAVSGQQVDIKGTKTAVQGTGMLDLTSSGAASLKGTITKIG